MTNKTIEIDERDIIALTNKIVTLGAIEGIPIERFVVMVAMASKLMADTLGVEVSDIRAEENNPVPNSEKRYPGFFNA